jgi:hypothetical protein
MILKYRKVLEQFEDGSSTTHRLCEPDYQEGDPKCTELCTIGADTYVHVPDDLVLPDQPDVLDMEAVSLTPELREEIKAASPHVRLSYKRLQDRIRSRYSLEDEQYLTRIGVGALSGAYTLQDGEPELIAAYQAWVEKCREIARLERAVWGL